LTAGEVTVENAALVFAEKKEPLGYALAAGDYLSMSVTSLTG
jgi:hypothetical protein